MQLICQRNVRLRGKEGVEGCVIEGLSAGEPISICIYSLRFVVGFDFVAAARQLMHN